MEITNFLNALRAIPGVTVGDPFKEQRDALPSGVVWNHDPIHVEKDDQKLLAVVHVSMSVCLMESPSSEEEIAVIYGILADEETNDAPFFENEPEAVERFCQKLIETFRAR